MRLMGNDYYKGVFAAYLGTGFMSHPIPGHDKREYIALL